MFSWLKLAYHNIAPLPDRYDRRYAGIRVPVAMISMPASILLQIQFPGCGDL